LNCKAGVAYVSELGLNLEIEHGLFHAQAALESAAAYVSKLGLNLEIEHGLFHAQAVEEDANEKAMPNTSFLPVVHTCYAVQASSISTDLSRSPPPPPRTSIFVQTTKLPPTRRTKKDSSKSMHLWAKPKTLTTTSNFCFFLFASPNPNPKFTAYHIYDPSTTGTGTIALDPTFGSFTLLDRTGFTLSEPVSLMKVFRLFRLKRIFFGVFF
jgi:hypothetical protein